jgi:putative transposase
MNYDPGQHHRRSIRLKGHDYAQAGMYFVTICTEGRACLFGEMAGDKVRLNDAGRIVEEEWVKTDDAMRPRVVLDQFVVMPNHIHGIILLMDGRGTLPRAPTQDRPTPTPDRFGKPAPDSISTVVRLFKAVTSKRINKNRGTPVAVWQRNYYEHVIRDGDSLDRIRQYTADNPARWLFDRENPQAVCPEEENALAHI